MNTNPNLFDIIQQQESIDLEEMNLQRNEFLIQAGSIEHHFYLIQQGAVRVYRITEHEEQTIRFGYSGSIITSLTSYLTDQPSELYIQAIRKTQVFAVRKTQFKSLIEQKQEWLNIYKDMMENLMVQQMEREIDLLTFSPLERLQRVMERSPRLFQEIPAKYIASYLRMTPETLSRIRK